MLLRDLFVGLDFLERPDVSSKFFNTEVSDVCYDSRNVVAGSVFVCIKGARYDGHDFAQKAFGFGAVCIISEKKLDLYSDVPVFVVADSRVALSKLSCNFFGNPSKNMKIVGITGTKGKTTTAFLLASILKKAGIRCAVFGTIGVWFDGKKFDTPNTTPESYCVQKYLRMVLDAGIEYVVMEASSQGLKQHRLSDVNFDCSVFTNFSLDHIGKYEHLTEDEYLQSKAILFKNCRCAFVNNDDPHTRKILEISNCKSVKTFALDCKADLTAENVELFDEEGCLGVRFLTCGIESLNIKLGLPGKFNVYNALAAIMVAKKFSIENRYIEEGLADARVKGRMELVNLPKACKFKVLIDYAHNTLSMESLLVTLHNYNFKRIIVIFGCGGNRSVARRSQMGNVCGKFADLCVVTADNSRFENTSDIIADIEVGLKMSKGSYVIIPNRREAIMYSICNAQPGDIVVLAGKGHEDYEDIRGEKRHFDEREIVEEAVNKFF